MKSAGILIQCDSKDPLDMLLDYKVFMIENKDYPVLAKEKRRTVDEDLCEF